MAAQQNHVGLRLKAPEELMRRDRLPSFKKRDLTLGGPNLQRPAGFGLPKTDPNAPKKVFVPNLNAQRSKSTLVKTSRDTTPRGRVTTVRGGRGGNQAGGQRRGDNLVQSQGVFSQGGAVAPLVKKSTSSRSYSSRESNAAEHLMRPVINKADVKIDPEVENRHIRDILGDNDEEDDETPDDGDKLMPISVEDYKRVKQEIKTETEGFEDFVKNQDTSLLLLQLPDTLPGLPSTTKMEAMNAKKDEPNTSTSSEFYTFRQVPEGQIGKLLKYRSGKMKLVLGENHVFDITHGIDQTFLQEVVSISTNAQERSGSIVNLGKIHGKLSVTPDWSKLFDGNS